MNRDGYRHQLPIVPCFSCVGVPDAVTLNRNGEIPSDNGRLHCQPESTGVQEEGELDRTMASLVLNDTTETDTCPSLPRFRPLQLPDYVAVSSSGIQSNPVVSMQGFKPLLNAGNVAVSNSGIQSNPVVSMQGFMPLQNAGNVAVSNSGVQSNPVVSMQGFMPLQNAGNVAVSNSGVQSNSGFSAINHPPSPYLLPTYAPSGTTQTEHEQRRSYYPRGPPVTHHTMTANNQQDTQPKVQQATLTSQCAQSVLTFDVMVSERQRLVMNKLMEENGILSEDILKIVGRHGTQCLESRAAYFEAVDNGNSPQSTNITDEYATAQTTRTSFQSSLLSIEASRGTGDINYEPCLSLGSRVQPKHPQYIDESVRVQSFNSQWPHLHNLHLSPLTVAKAGFYYSGSGDRVNCFHCGLVLYNWNITDNPIHEHWRNKTDCEFIRTVLGQSMPDRQCPDTSFHVTDRQYRPEDLYNYPRRQTLVPPLVTDNINSMPYVQNGLQNGTAQAGGAAINDPQICQLCHANKIGVVQLPCGHIVCAVCASKVNQLGLMQCGICRQQVTKIVAYDRSQLLQKAYFP